MATNETVVMQHVRFLVREIQRDDHVKLCGWGQQLEYVPYNRRLVPSTDEEMERISMLEARAVDLVESERVRHMTNSPHTMFTIDV